MYNIISIAVTIVILAAVAVFLTILFTSTNEETKAVFGEDSVQFTGMYGETYAYADISSVTLEDNIPAIGEKTNGAGLGDVKKGDWTVDGLGKCRLYVMSANGPYVVMKTNGGCVIISFKDPEKTKGLYESLREKI
jgi:hypothetical protein